MYGAIAQRVTRGSEACDDANRFEHSTPAEETRCFVGVVVQPLLAAGLAFFGFPIFLLDTQGRTLAGSQASDVVGAAASVAFVVGVVAFLVTVALALPTAVWLMKRRRISVLQAAGFGLGFGNLPFGLGTLLAGTYGVSGFLRGAAFSSFLGAAGGAAFWYITLRQLR